MNSNIFREELDMLRGYIPGKSIEEVKKEYGVDEIVKLGSNENPTPPSAKVLDAIQKAAAEVNIYPDPMGIELRKKISAKYGIHTDNIVIGAGGMGVILATAGSLVKKGDEVIVPAVSFPGFGLKQSLFGAKLVKIPLEKYDFDLEATLEAISDKTKMIYLCNPNNPTGGIIPKDKLREFIMKVPENIVIFIDEAYYYYAEKNPEYLKSVELLDEKENLIILRSFSKSSGLAGTRVGFGLTSKKIADNIRKVMGPFSVDKLALAAACVAVNDSEYLEQTVELNAKSLEIMETYFEESNFEYIKSSANFVFVNVNKHSKEVSEELMRKGVIVRPGYQWGWENWLRVSTGTIEQTEIFISKLKEVLA